jgi:hypothetical protein
MQVWKHHLRWSRPAAIVLLGLPLVAGIILGANQTRAGAYLSWPLSITYWTIMSLVTWWSFAVATHALRWLLKPWAPPIMLVYALGAVVGSFAARPAIYWIANAFRPAMNAPELREMVSASLNAEFLAYYLTNWSVVIAMWIVACWWMRTASQRLAADQQTTNVHPQHGHDETGFMTRLPPEIGRQVIAIQAEDHYVRVHTLAGNALILASLSDAIEAVTRSGIDGEQTHRSWWVARDAVTHHEARGRKQVLHLSNGIEVPISVTFRKLVAAKGLLAA